MKHKFSKLFLVTAFVAAVGIGTFAGGTETHAMSRYGGYVPKTVGESIEMAYWYYFLR
ncbi:hypothetical protein ACFFK0_17820 [Paenibacillus chartarius]|uniref:Uncharacterized protein n=1 Tax=Paenibacillus chartarius TaxID=747481 RepID=A0ABV6DNR1_9BACL